MHLDIKNMRIKKWSLIGFLFYLPFSEPGALQSFGAVNAVYALGKIAVLVLFALDVFQKIALSKYRPSGMVWLLVAFYAELIGITVVRGNGIQSVLIYSMPVILFSLELDSLESKKAVYALDGAAAYFAALIVINLLTILIFPGGISAGEATGEKYYFLGHTNSTIRIVLPGIVFAAVSDYLRYSALKKKTYLLLILTMVTVTLTWSNTAMIGCGILLFYVLFLKNKRLNKVLNPKLIFCAVFICFAGIILLDNVSVLSGIARLFGKDTSLVGRTNIWRTAVAVISKRPLFGYGYGVSVPQIENWDYTPSSFHNYFLDLLFRGGIVHLAIQLVIVWRSCGKIARKSSPTKQFLTVTLFAYFVMWQAEPFVSTGVLGMMLIWVICDRIDEWELDFEGASELAEP